jgi:hypothetical protein
MKVIFLDIDGVLNHEKWYRKRHQEIKMDDVVSHYPFYEFDPESINQLNRIIDETGANVVISSTWRHGRTIEQLQEILEKVGFRGVIIDKTPSFYIKGVDENGEKFSYTVPRGCEIDSWLESKGKFRRVNWSRDLQIEYLEESLVKNYVILDDDSDMLLTQKEHFVKTLSMDGLTKEKADECVNILNKTIMDLYYEDYIFR